MSMGVGSNPYREYYSQSYSKKMDDLVEKYAEEAGYNMAINPLLPPHAKKEKLKLEFHEKVKSNEFNQHMANAISLFKSEGRQFFSKSHWEKFEEELIEADIRMSQFDYETELTTN